MLDRLLSAIAPHPCSSCGAVGAILCEHCKYDIISESYSACLQCGTPAAANGTCNGCALPYQKAWCVGERSGALQRLVGNYKFQRVYAAHQAIADILDTRLGVLPADAVIVPVPTVAAHIRERGYDHTLLVAKALAKRRNLAVSTVLRRRTTTKQRGASRAERQTQACDAFYVADTPPDVAHVIFDDIVTTGATMRYAAQALRNAGVSQVWALAVARQPLD